MPNPDCRQCAFYACYAQKRFCEHRRSVVFELKLMVGWGEHKRVVDESGFRVYSADLNWGLNFVSVCVEIFEF